jgi:HSP20 family protein
MAEKTEKDTRSLARFDPFRELTFGDPRDWFRARPWSLGRFFDDFVSERPPIQRPPVPAIDVSEDEKQYTLTVELAGVPKEDVTIEIEGGVLTIRGEKKSEREERKERRHWVERSYGSFARSFTLPADAKPDRVEASCKDGVLTLTIAKSEQAKPRVIAIK